MNARLKGRFTRLGLAAGLLAIAGLGITAWLTTGRFPAEGDSPNVTQLALGKSIYAQRCANCHGVNLEGQPNWQDPLADGKLPAPPHDASGHTWHHPDKIIAGLIKCGLAPYAGDDYKSNMPAFRGLLSDAEIAAVIVYLKSAWPERERNYQARVSEQPAGAADKCDAG